MAELYSEWDSFLSQVPSSLQPPRRCFPQSYQQAAAYQGNQWVTNELSVVWSLNIANEQTLIDE